MNNSNSRFRYKLLSRDPNLRITDIDRCLYAVSVSDETKSIDRAIAGLLWAKGRFPNCSVLLGDSLFRFANALQVGPSAVVADTTDTMIAGIASQIKAIAGANTEILSTSTVQNDSRYDKFLTAIKADYQRVEKLRESVDRTASTYVDRQLAQKKIKVDQKNAALEKSKEYLLREIAIYDLLACDGWVTDIYLGQEIEPLALIISGEIRDCGRMLHMRNNISIRTR